MSLHTIFGRRAMLLASVALLALAASPSRADIVFSVQSVNAFAGSNGNFFDVRLTNTGPSAVTVAGFSFGLTASPLITFTQVTTATTAPAPYIFAGNSLFGPVITLTPTPAGSSIAAADNFLTPNAGVSVAAGATVGLGRVFFNVAGGAPQGTVVPIGFSSFPTTSLSGTPTAGNIPITTLTPGTITVTVPEPSTLSLLGLGFAVVSGVAIRRRSRIAS